VSLTQELANLVKANLKAKTFSSGSKGFHATGKITVDGIRYQAQAQAVVIGSKNDPKLKVKASVQQAANVLTTVVEDIKPKTFASGNTGYYTNDKAEIADQRYQVAVQAVRLSGQ
jgi:hypothetical protein